MSQVGVFVAEFPFACACCGTRYRAGVRAMHNEEDEVVKVGCVHSGETITEAEQAHARKAMCGKCFLVHAPHQGKECA